jgi:hypothetical protein
MGTSISEGIDAYCQDKNIDTWEDFVEAIATQQHTADTEHEEDWKVNKYEYTGYSLENTGFSQPNTALEIGFVGMEIEVTGISVGGTGFGVETTIAQAELKSVKDENGAIKFDGSGLLVAS